MLSDIHLDDNPASLRSQETRKKDLWVQEGSEQMTVDCWLYIPERAQMDYMNRDVGNFLNFLNCPQGENGGAGMIFFSCFFLSHPPLQDEQLKKGG